ncbi:MAG: hypothetical protein RIC24_05080 [Hyphomicrobiales bacterium]|jgi:hypothetical protein
MSVPVFRVTSAPGGKAAVTDFGDFGPLRTFSSKSHATMLLLQTGHSRIMLHVGRSKVSSTDKATMAQFAPNFSIGREAEYRLMVELPPTIYQNKAPNGKRSRRFSPCMSRSDRVPKNPQNL